MVSSPHDSHAVFLSPDRFTASLWAKLRESSDQALVIAAARSSPQRSVSTAPPPAPPSASTQNVIDTTPVLPVQSASVEPSLVPTQSFHSVVARQLELVHSVDRQLRCDAPAVSAAGLQDSVRVSDTETKPDQPLLIPSLPQAISGGTGTADDTLVGGDSGEMAIPMKLRFRQEIQHRSSHPRAPFLESDTLLDNNHLITKMSQVRVSLRANRVSLSRLHRRLDLMGPTPTQQLFWRLFEFVSGMVRPSHPHHILPRHRLRTWPSFAQGLLLPSLTAFRLLLFVFCLQFVWHSVFVLQACVVDTCEV